jgi:hypothetical protein
MSLQKQLRDMRPWIFALDCWSSEARILAAAMIDTESVPGLTVDQAVAALRLFAVTQEFQIMALRLQPPDERFTRVAKLLTVLKSPANRFEDVVAILPALPDLELPCSY